VATASRVLLAEGASDATRGIDAAKAAKRAAKRSKRAAAAGVRDVAQGADLLAASEDLAVQSAAVSAMSADDLNLGMKLASIAGQLLATGNVMATLGMPAFADFMVDKGEELQELAVDELLRSGTTRALATAMAETGAQVGELGEGEVAEGIDRLVESEDMEIQSELLAEAGDELTEQGLVEMEASQEMREAANKIRTEGVAEIATGAEEVGEAEKAEVVAKPIEKK
jgi:hypothetical protein